MLLFLATLFLLLISNTSSTFNKWAVLIAGSNSYYNYRHQSDVSHSYQILRTLGGYPRENIITFMYDDIAYNDANPFPGQLFNEPNGTNVYDDIQIDYKNTDVNAKNFLDCIRGNPITDRPDLPVLDSTNSDSHIFIYYSDHGANGLIAMPTGDPLYAVDLIAAFKEMKDNSKFNELVFYLEACESGSMFEDILDSDLSIYAMTAANSMESSYAFYYNETIGTYLADEYSIRWMQDTSKYWENEWKNQAAEEEESILNQYDHVQKQVNLSHVMQYGDFSFVNESIHNFQSKSVGTFDESQNCWNPDKNNKFDAFNATWIPNKNYMDSRDVKLAYLQYRYLNVKGNALKRMEYKRMIEIEIAKRKNVDLLMDDIIDFACNSDQDLISKIKCEKMVNTNEWECLKSVYSQFDNECQKFDDYSLKHVRMLSNLCQIFNEKYINHVIQSVCSI